MTIQIKPEQEFVIGQAIEAGLIETADQAVEVGVEIIRQRLERRRKTLPIPAANLAALFANSPFAGLDMAFEQRDPDIPERITGPAYAGGFATSATIGPTSSV